MEDASIFPPIASGPEAAGRTRADIHTIRHVYLDIDTDGPAVLDKVFSDIRIPKPNYILNTSPGKYQTLWKVQDFSIGQAESLQRAMAGEFGADQAVIDAARVLRIPGFYNKKHEERHQVTARRLSDDVYRPEHFRINVPEFSSDSSMSRTATTKASSASLRPEGRISQSERDWAYAKRKLSLGVDPEEVIQAITEYRPDKWKPEAYARRTVEKALAEIHGGGSSEEARSPVDR
jgi:RepB DNA-primase from phage plasmid